MVAKDSLTDKQERFVEEYLVDLNASAAAVRAGYAEGSAGVSGCRLLKEYKIQRLIAEKRKSVAEYAEVSVVRILEEYRRIAFADLRDVVQVRDGQVYITDTDALTPEQAASLSEISQTKDGIRVKIFDKQRALDSMAKHLGMFIEQHQVETIGPPPVIQFLPATRRASDDE